VLTVIPPAPEEDETYLGPLHLKIWVKDERTGKELTPPDFTPNFEPKTKTLVEQAKHAMLRHPVWYLEFTFKPLRMIAADVPQPNGQMKRKVIWYLVYRIRNTGSHLVPKPARGAPPVQTFVTESANDLQRTPESMPTWFCPIFVLEGWVQDLKTKKYVKVPYIDRLIPSLSDPQAVPKGTMPAIQAKEDPAIPLLNSAQMAEKLAIPLSDDSKDNSLWGVATWEDVDPRIDFVSIYVQGLTNAFRFRELPDGKRVYQYKTLQLNFWRPGDTRAEAADKIRFGVPLVENPVEQVRIFGFHAVPGPMITAHEFDAQTDKQAFLFEIDAQLDADMESVLQKELTGGNLPAAVRQAFTDAGITIPGGVTLNMILDQKQWDFQANVDGVSRNFRLRYQPKYWEMTKEGLKIRERVDHLWVYR
jgi:hypothetical protein